MRRTISVLAAMAVVAAMFAVMAMPALAVNTFQAPFLLSDPDIPQEQPPGPPTVSGGPKDPSSLEAIS